MNQQIAPLQQPKRPAFLSADADRYTSWRPETGWLFLLPSRIASKKGDIILPESYTKKSNSGICFRANVQFGQETEYLDRECLFPNHIEYRVDDSDTGYEFYVVPADKVIMTRIPPPEILAVSRDKGPDAPKFETIEHSNRT